MQSGDAETDRPVEDIECDLMPAFDGDKLARLLVKHLDIEKEAGPVEDDGGWRSGQLHVS